MKRYAMDYVWAGDMMIESPEGAYVQHVDVVEIANDAARYQELIFAVGKKWVGESRHETALRYIRQAENVPCEKAKTIDAAMEATK